MHFLRALILPSLLGLTLAACDKEQHPDRRVAGANPDSGKLLIEFYQCGACHTIPGVRGARGVVGPPLTDFGKRSLIAGAIANQPENLAGWIADPQAVEEGTAMPDLGVTVAEARDISAYLYTLY